MSTRDKERFHQTWEGYQEMHMFVKALLAEGIKDQKGDEVGDALVAHLEALSLDEELANL